MTEKTPVVVAGVDTHRDTHHVAIIDSVTGGQIADAQFPATGAGYRGLTGFLLDHGRVLRVGVEGTNSYGAALTRHLQAQSITVVEVIRPNRAERRLHGKSDPLDALTAARTTLARNDLPIPKTGVGPAESIRVLTRIRDSAVKSRTRVMQQIKMLLVTSPDDIRESFRHLSDTALWAAVEHIPGDPCVDTVNSATLTALRRLGARYAYLDSEINSTTAELEILVDEKAPAMLATAGVGVVTAATLLAAAGDNAHRIRNAAAFAAFCGVCPIPASSGKTNRHRLNRGGDRQANWALHQIALVRMSFDARSRDYVAKKIREGKSTREAMRCLKRAISREVYHLLTDPPPVRTFRDLRPKRHSHGWSLQHVADHLDVWPARISEIERGKRRYDPLADTYRRFLDAA